MQQVRGPGRRRAHLITVARYDHRVLAAASNPTKIARYRDEVTQAVPGSRFLDAGALTMAMIDEESLKDRLTRLAREAVPARCKRLERIVEAQAVALATTVLADWVAVFPNPPLQQRVDCLVAPVGPPTGGPSVCHEEQVAA